MTSFLFSTPDLCPKKLGCIFLSLNSWFSSWLQRPPYPVHRCLTVGGVQGPMKFKKHWDFVWPVVPYTVNHAIIDSLIKVTSSECSRDEPFIVEERTFASEEECVALCQAFTSIPSLGCTFAAWEDLGAFGTCILYKEPFADYISHCQQLSGPPDTSGCSVENPEENSCDVIRFFVIIGR